MAIPTFGFRKIEALACILMVVAGAAGLLLVLTGSSDWILSAFGGKWASAHVSSLWLVLQSLAVIRSSAERALSRGPVPVTEKRA